jgi:RNA polymerase sigma-70 factor (ECF subfamily)
VLPAAAAARLPPDADASRVNHTAAGAEEELLARLRRGDDEAFASLFRAHYPTVLAAAARLLGDRSRAEEIAQDVMLELWRRREGLVLGVPVGAYLHQAARNRALNQLRHERTTQRGEPFVRVPTASPRADQRALSGELAAAAKDALLALSAPQREVFELSRLRGLTYAEIAELLGISIKTVEARMGRALKELRERLAPWLPEGGGW